MKMKQRGQDRWWRPGLVVLSLWAGSALVGAQQESKRPDERARGIERLREKLAERSPLEVERLERNLRELQELPREERLQLLRRARELREQERRIEPELRDELEGLGPERARDVRRERLRDEFQKRGREMRSRIPAPLREKLEKAPPEQRRRMMRGLMRDREHSSRRAVDSLGGRSGVTERELERLRELSPLERLKAVRRLKGQATDERRPDRPRHFERQSDERKAPPVRPDRRGQDRRPGIPRR